MRSPTGPLLGLLPVERHRQTEPLTKLPPPTRPELLDPVPKQADLVLLILADPAERLDVSSQPARQLSIIDGFVQPVPLIRQSSTLR